MVDATKYRLTRQVVILAPFRESESGDNEFSGRSMHTVLFT